MSGIVADLCRQANLDGVHLDVKEGVAALPRNWPLYAGLYLPVLQSQEEFDEAVKYALTAVLTAFPSSAG